MPTIDELANEIVTQVKAADARLSNTFYIYDESELPTLNQEGGVQPPYVGVSFEGTSVASLGAAARGTQPGLKSSAIVYQKFSVVIGVSYESAVTGDSTSQRKKATDLLDSIRSQLLGYGGLNKRPWTFLGDYPIGRLKNGDEDHEGVIYYGQLWETSVPIVGTQAN